jgi:protein gp37
MANRLRRTERYKDGFKPRFNEEELYRKFKPGIKVFVSSMGDLFGEWVPSEWVIKVIKFLVKGNPETTFFFETKNPGRYFEFIEIFPENVILSSTIESNRDYPVSRAPSVKQRYEAMKNLPWSKKHISIEPIMDFDESEFLRWIREINPMIVSVGYDNYHNNLPEPSLGKTLRLIGKLEEFTKVERKTIPEK